MLQSAALPGQGPPANSLRHEMLVVRACTGHVLHEQTHAGMLDSEMASVPAGPEQANTRATRMVFPVNTSVLQCRCHTGGRAAKSFVCVCVCVWTGAIRCILAFLHQGRSGLLLGKSFFVGELFFVGHYRCFNKCLKTEKKLRDSSVK